MRTIERSTVFRRDYKRVAKGRQADALETLLIDIVTILASDHALEPRFRDHPLGGDWIGYRECHVRPDLLLIYRKADGNVLRLARLGSHSELFD